MSMLQIPMVYGYYLMPPMPMNLEFQPSIVADQPQPEIPDGEATLNETERTLRQFVGELGELAQEKLSVERLEINRRGNERLLSSFPKFEDIYSSGFERYKHNYTEGQKKTSWGRSDIALFLWVLDKFCLLHQLTPSNFREEHWIAVSRLVPFRNSKGCMFKWLSLRKHRLEEYPWQPEEEQYLFALAETHQKNDWVTISRELFEKFSKTYRSPKQCREHWALHLNSLHERAKKLWGLHEDVALMESFKTKGRRWKEISRDLEGRSENAIKNRFTLIMKKYGLGLEKYSPDKKTSIILKRISDEYQKERQSREILRLKLEAMEGQFSAVSCKHES